MSDNDDTAKALRKVMIPMIRKAVPGLIAQGIVSVQPIIFPTRIPMETGETYKNDAVAYSNPGDEVEYYWVKPSSDFSLFSIDTQYERNNQIFDWCVETYGTLHSWAVPDRRWFGSDQKYYFRDEADRTLFILKWGGE